MSNTRLELLIINIRFYPAPYFINYSWPSASGLIAPHLKRGLVFSFGIYINHCNTILFHAYKSGAAVRSCDYHRSSLHLAQFIVWCIVELEMSTTGVMLSADSILA